MEMYGFEKMKEHISSVGIIGAGQMGSGIAQVFATNGYSVVLIDLQEEILLKARNNILFSLNKLHEKNKLSLTSERIVQNILFSTNFSDLSRCDVFIESVFENFEVKSNILYKIESFITPQSFIATNTSSYSISTLSQLISHPDRFIGFHFMNPVPLIDLVEIVKSPQTSQETFSFFFNLAKNLGKTPVVSKDHPGFILNRILIPMINEAIYALYDGIATAEDIDITMKLGANHPIGPLALADLIGLDTVLAIMKTLQQNLCSSKYCPCPLLEQYVSERKLGRKTKEGFFKY